MMKLLGVIVVCAILSAFLGPLPFIVAGVAYFVTWVVRR
jgi:hypothetical protein